MIELDAVVLSLEELDVVRSSEPKGLEKVGHFRKGTVKESLSKYMSDGLTGATVQDVCQGSKNCHDGKG